MSDAMGHPTPENLMSLMDGEADAAQAAAWRAHVNRCLQCRAILADWAEVARRTSAWRTDAAPAGLGQAVLAAVPPSSRTAIGRPRPGGWARYRWHVAAAAMVLLAVFVGDQISVCGQALCRVPWPAAHDASARMSAPSGSAPRATSSPWAGAAAAPSAQTSSASTFAAQWTQTPRVDFGMPADSTPVVILWFFDYECPACAAAEGPYAAALNDYAAAHPGMLKIVSRDFPWNAECNPMLSQTIHGHEGSCAAAVAMRLARETGSADALKRWLLHSQPATAAEVRNAAASLGQVTDFDARYPSEVAAIRLELQALADRQAAPHSTPAIFINGRPGNTPDSRLLPIGLLIQAIEIEAGTQAARGK